MPIKGNPLTLTGSVPAAGHRDNENQASALILLESNA